MATRVSSSRLVGRAAPLAELGAAWRETEAGRASLAFVAGESGVGKSRLLAALRAHVREAGGHVLCGDCVELGEGELPYAALVSALRPLARGAEGASLTRTLPEAHRAELGAFLPGLAEAEGRDGLLGGDGDPARAQARLFEAVLALLEALAAQAPVLLVVEDLHWADRSTRAFLTFLGRALGTGRLLVVASYRPDELHRRHPLRPLLAALEREPHARRVELAPLDRPELAEQLEDILGAPPDDALVERVWRRSEGNPLHTEELLAAGLDGRGAPPATLRDALMLRVERLDERTQEVVRVLAAAGRADHDILARATQLDPAELRASLRDAVAAHVVAVTADGGHGLRHALLREVLADDLLPGERTDLHRRLAAAYEGRRAERGDDAHLAAEIAHHHLAARDRPAALAAAVHAADMARRIHAHGEAAALLERALELVDLVPDAEAIVGPDRVDLLVRTASDHHLSGETTRSEALLRGALDALGEERSERRAHVLVQLGNARWSLGRQEQGLAAAEEALEVLGPDGPPCLARAAALGFLAKAHMLMGRARLAVAEADAAIAEAERCPDDVEVRAGIGRARNIRGVARMNAGDAVRGEADLRAAMEIARADDRWDELHTAHVNLADGLHLTGRTHEGMAVLRAGLGLSREGSRQHRWLRLSLAELLVATGELEEAAGLLEAHDRPLVGTEEALRLMTAATLAARLGDDDRARELLDRAEPLTAQLMEPQFLAPVGALRAEVARRDGDLERAAAEVEDALGRLVTCTEDASRIGELAATGVAVLADLAVREALLGRERAARAARRRAADLEELVAAALVDREERAVEQARLLGARADLARADGRERPELHERAADAWEALGRRPAALARRLRAAEAHVGADDRERAAALVAAVREDARALGPRSWVAAEADRLAARARLRTPAAAPGDDPGQATPAGPPDDPFGLTAREREVLALVAAGATNREIGAQLFMAEKTASVHVSRILAKLDVRTRTQAAAVAHRAGLHVGQA